MTRRTPHLFVSISPHGLGHAAITAPLLNGLWREMPYLGVTVHSSVSQEWLRGRLERPFAYTGRTRDFGLAMLSPSDVDVDASAGRYAALIADWDAALDEERRLLRRSGATLVLSNISFLTLAAAKAEGLPAVSLCPFDWAEVYRAYCAAHPSAPEVLARMDDAYAWAAPALRPVPLVPNEAANVVPIGPIAKQGTRRREEVARLLGLGEGERVGLIAFGGIQNDHSPDHWPVFPGWRWIMGQNLTADRPDMICFDGLPLPFVDLIASVDVVVTKPGYGTFTEAGCAGTPLLTMERPGWPEWPHMFDWLKTHSPVAAISPERLRAGEFAAELDSLVSARRLPPACPSGIAEAVAAMGRALAEAG